MINTHFIKLLIISPDTRALEADSLHQVLVLENCILRVSGRYLIVELHYNDVIMSSLASQITSLTIAYPTVYSRADQRNIKAPRHWPLCGEFTGGAEMFPFDDVIMIYGYVIHVAFIRETRRFFKEICVKIAEKYASNTRQLLCWWLQPTIHGKYQVPCWWHLH